MLPIQVFLSPILFLLDEVVVHDAPVLEFDDSVLGELAPDDFFLEVNRGEEDSFVVLQDQVLGFLNLVRVLLSSIVGFIDQVLSEDAEDRRLESQDRFFEVRYRFLESPYRFLESSYRFLESLCRFLFAGIGDE